MSYAHTFHRPRPRERLSDFELPEMVQATFYAMLLNEAAELGVVHGFMAEGLKAALGRLRWSSFEAWMSRVNHEQREAQLRQQAVAVEVRGPSDGQEESSGSNGPPPPLVTRNSLSFILNSLLYQPLSFLRQPLMVAFDNQMDSKLWEPRGKVGVAGFSLEGCTSLDISPLCL
ncbi:hypothetical protein Cgig2_009977 [Carnegiea gigantea]|uniref:Uncharacterized protein n=1 Tax=Carnegiea gigantea TaxID=171969 RepID=A0A9Q1JPX4_9CARY|nr:hypothetical protein Cgig2_009977 [Carnegiea gigantea]